MKYNTYINSDPADLSKMLRENAKTPLINTMRDYYQGVQWDLSNSAFMQGETRYTRSGKEMWKSFDENKSRGLTAGELKVWNAIKASIDLYARYTRGDEADDISIRVKQNGKVDEALSKEIENIFWELNNWAISTTTQMSIDSVAVIKYKQVEGDVMNVMRMTDTNTGATIVNVDARTICPIYFEGMVRGVINYYYIDKADAKELTGKTHRKDAMYWEVYMIEDNGAISLKKYIENEIIEELVTEHKVLPFVIMPNAKHPFKNYSLHSIEVSDVEDLIDIQDDINAYLTDLGIILRKVAIPMLKATDDFIQKASAGDIEKVKKTFSKISTMAGQILFAPIERVQGGDVGTGTIQYLEELKNQLYTITSIPKSVFNSEGLGNISAKTLEYLYTSLAKKVGEKRTKITEIIRSIAYIHMLETDRPINDLEVDVIFPPMLGQTRSERSEILIAGDSMEVLPKEYLTEQYAEMLGDAEKVEEIKGQLNETNVKRKQEVETIIARNGLSSI